MPISVVSTATTLAPKTSVFVDVSLSEPSAPPGNAADNPLPMLPSKKTPRYKKGLLGSIFPAGADFQRTLFIPSHILAQLLVIYYGIRVFSGWYKDIDPLQSFLSNLISYRQAYYETHGDGVHFCNMLRFSWIFMILGLLRPTCIAVCPMMFVELYLSILSALCTLKFLPGGIVFPADVMREYVSRHPELKQYNNFLMAQLLGYISLLFFIFHCCCLLILLRLNRFFAEHEYQVVKKTTKKWWKRLW